VHSGPSSTLFALILATSDALSLAFFALLASMMLAIQSRPARNRSASEPSMVQEKLDERTDRRAGQGR
jgi:hypothetical protein